MVSAGGRKSSQRRRRQPQQGRRQKNHARRPPSKRRKPQAKQKPAGPQKKGAAKVSFDPISAKALGQIKRDGKLLSREAKLVMVSFLQDVYKQVSKEADRLRRESRHPVAGPTHVQAALRRVMPKRWRPTSSVASRSGH